MDLRAFLSPASLLIPALLLAQAAEQRTDTPFDKEHFANANGLKKALSAIKQGDALFQNGGTHYTEALEQYDQAYTLNPDNAELNLKMGLCHLNGRYHYKAVGFFQNAYALQPSIPRIHFLLGYGYQLTAEWDKAIAEYGLHRASMGRAAPDPEPMYNSADRRIAECNNGKAFYAKPTSGQVSNMGPAINSEVADYGVLITADGEHMMFTSRRNNSTGGKINKATHEYFEDIYACDRAASGWTEPLPMAQPVNSPINDASVGLFNDGRTMIVYRDVDGTGDLFETKREGDIWSEPVTLGGNVNSGANESSAWYSFDRKQLFFVSDREGGQGGQDIYVSRWDDVDKQWGIAENLGATINTPEDEDGVFIHPDGKTLYFSSKGHNCMGGYDVFKSTLADGHWSKPENLGWPINSPDDDLFFVLTADGSTGYFSSVRPSGMGEDDIYRVDFLPETKGEETASLTTTGKPAKENTNAMRTVLLKGRIMDLKMLAGMEATIELMDLQDAHLVATFTSDAKTGEFMAALPSGHDYAMSIHADGFLLHSENISMPADGGSLEMNMNITLQPIETGHQEVMRNIFFERDLAALNPTSLAEMGQLLSLLRENPKLRLEIGGHTDSDGTVEHNDQLSNARAQAVVDHLIANGIAPDRLQAKGYGSNQGLVANDTEEHKAQNRRTEMRVL